MKTTILKTLLGALLLSLCGMSVSVQAAPRAQSTHLNIPAQPLRDALAAFGRQTGLQVIYTATDVTDTLMAPAIVGAFTVQDGLTRMLSQSGLRYEYLDQRTV